MLDTPFKHGSEKGGGSQGGGQGSTSENKGSGKGERGNKYQKAHHQKNEGAGKGTAHTHQNTNTLLPCENGKTKKDTPQDGMSGEGWCLPTDELALAKHPKLAVIAESEKQKWKR